MSGVFVDAISYALGERQVHIRDSADEGRLLSSVSDLEYAGFSRHHICEPFTTAYDLAVKAVQPLADKALLEDISAIVYGTCLPMNANAGVEASWQESRNVKYLMDFAAGRLQAEFELDGAIVIGLNQQGCTTMLGSLRLATAYLAVEPDWHRVLCVTADRFPPNALYEQAYSPISDGSAACLVSTEPKGLRFLVAHHITNGGLGQADDDETVGTYFAFTARLIRETLEKAGLNADELDWVVTQNTNKHAWQVLGRVLGIDHNKVWAPSAPEVAHVISADIMINLAALIESGRTRPGERIALVMAGFGLNWQCVILEVVDDGTALRPA